jgi:sodium transport system permease protein
MSLRLGWVVLRKELIDGLRDRRALLSALVFPLLGPALIAMMMNVIAEDEDTRGPLEIPVVGAEHAPSLTDFLESGGAVVVDPPDDPEEAVRSGDLPLVVVVPDDFVEDMRAGRPASVELIVDKSRNASRADVSRADRLLEAWGSQTAVLRLLARGIDPTLVQPLSIDEVDLATPEQRAANLLEMVVMFIIMSAFVGCMYLAMDATAGERERKSLEPLLTLPVPRWALVGGKFIAATAYGLLAALLTTGTVVIAMNNVPLELLGVRVQLTPPTVLRLLLVTLPLAPLAAALQLAISSAATSIKEAQTWLSMTLFLPMVPGMIMSIRPMNPEPWMALVPVLGQQVLSGAALRGEPLPPLELGLASVSIATLTVLTLGVLVVLFGNERILRRR